MATYAAIVGTFALIVICLHLLFHPETESRRPNIIETNRNRPFGPDEDMQQLHRSNFRGGFFLSSKSANLK